MSDAINRCPAHCRSKGGVVNSHFSHLSCRIFPATLHNFTIRVSPDPREGLARETSIWRECFLTKHYSIPLFSSLSSYFMPIINPRRACAARVTVSVSVYDYSRTAGNEAASERYQQLQRNKRSKIKMAILLKQRCSRSRNWHYRIA